MGIGSLATAFGVGLFIGIVGILFIVNVVINHINLIKVDYVLVLKGDDGKTIKPLANFTKFYWNDKNAVKDIKLINSYCDDIRSNLKDEDNYLLDMITENFEVDFTKIYVEHIRATIKPL